MSEATLAARPQLGGAPGKFITFQPSSRLPGGCWLEVDSTTLLISPSQSHPREQSGENFRPWKTPSHSLPQSSFLSHLSEKSSFFLGKTAVFRVLVGELFFSLPTHWDLVFNTAVPATRLDCRFSFESFQNQDAKILITSVFSQSIKIIRTRRTAHDCSWRF